MTIVKTLLLGILCSMSLVVVASHPSSAYSQTKRFTFTLTNASIAEVMRYIEYNSEFVFLYLETGLDTSRRVDVEVSDAPIQAVLQQMLGNSIGYEIADRQIIIKNPVEPKTTASPQQTRTVTGVVVDANGESIIGATVVVKGDATNGTITNVDGVFTLSNVPASATQITVSYIGYTTQDVNITSGRMRIVMTEDTQMLEEVVVTGMTKMDKRLFTGAATQLNAEDVKMDGVADISRALEGRVAGVSVQNVSGTFGTAPKIKVRGATSIYGDSKPLWVVDGVIMENVSDVSSDALSSGDAETVISNAIAGLNASDIASFDILKDGSATSIYGAKAMAGVIVITTKKGRSGAASVNYTGEFTSRLIPSYSDFNIMNSQEQMDVYTELEAKGWLNYASTYRDRYTGVYGKMYEMMNTYNPQTGTYLLANTKKARNAYLRAAEMRNTDWFKELFSMVIMHNHSLSISGGNDRTNYYGSISMMVDPGWYKSSGLNRYTASMKLEHKISTKLTASLKSNASYRQQKAPGTLGQTVNNLYGEVSRDFDINPYSYALNSSRTLDPDEFYTRNFAPFNISTELENNTLDFNVVDLIFQGELKWQPIKQLSISALAAMKYTGTSYEHDIKDESNQALAYRAMADSYVMSANPYLYDNPDEVYDLPISVLPEGGIYERTDRRVNSFDFRLSGDYNMTFNDDHITHIYAGLELNSADKFKSWFRGWGRQYSNGDIAMFAWQAFKKSQEEDSEYFNVNNTRDRGVAMFGMINYSYQGKYNMNLTGRYEGSNRLGKSRRARWLPTWNIGLAWNAHEEEWFKKQNILSHATLRGSYSLTADRGPSSVSNSDVIIRSMVGWRPQTENQETALNIDELANYGLTYEKKHEFNVGFDLGFAERVSFSTDVYQRNNFDLIGVINVMGLGGQIEKKANVAAMESYGTDIQLSIKNIVTKDFSWTTDFIYSLAKTKITQLKTDNNVMTLVRGTESFLEGYPHRALFSIPFAGLNSEGLPTFYDEDGKTIIQKVDFQERILTDYLKYEGPIEPPIFGSFGNVFRYKNFRFNVYLTYSFGNKVRLDPVFSSSYSDLDATPKEFENRWMKPGDEKIPGVLPVIASKRQVQDLSDIRYAYSAYNYSTERVADGGFVRLKEISAQYTFPAGFVKQVGLSNMSVKLQGTNLWLIYADKKLNGQDPEFVRAGGVSSPMARQITATLNIGF